MNSNKKNEEVMRMIDQRLRDKDPEMIDRFHDFIEGNVVGHKFVAISVFFTKLMEIVYMFPSVFKSLKH